MSIYLPQENFSKKYPEINLNEYFEFIKVHSLSKSIKFETSNHHILPKWAFPEYQKFGDFSWNKAILTHKNHLIAHFMLWNAWDNCKNASPLLLMCSKKERESWSLSGMIDFSESYHDACRKHAESASEIHTGRIVSKVTTDKSKQTRIKNGTDKHGMMNCTLISSGESVHISNTEYKNNKNILYRHFRADKPAWNSGMEMLDLKNKVWVIEINSGNYVHMSSEEYKKNKHMYIHPATGRIVEHGLTPAYNAEKGEYEKVPIEEYRANKDKYNHPTSNLIWFNNGSTNLRLKPTDDIPDGFIKGRLKSDLFGHKKKKFVTCPHCNLTGASGNMSRYHFDNCKLNHQELQ